MHFVLYLVQISTSGHTFEISENFTSMFDVSTFTGVGLDTFSRVANLTLDQGEFYTASVVAVDQSGTCVMVDKPFMVDITSPITGRIGIGPDVGLVSHYHHKRQKFIICIRILFLVRLKWLALNAGHRVAAFINHWKFAITGHNL